MPEPYSGNEEAQQVQNIPEPQGSILPVDEGIAGRDKENEEKRQAELNAARAEHNRRTAGGDPKVEKAQAEPEPQEAKEEEKVVVPKKPTQSSGQKAMGRKK